MINGAVDTTNEIFSKRLLALCKDNIQEAITEEGRAVVVARVEKYILEQNGNLFVAAHILKKRKNVENKFTPAEILHEVFYLRYLIEQGADVNYSDGYGYTPLHHACLITKAHPIKIHLVKALLENGAEPNLKNYRGETPMHYIIRAREWSRPEMFESILKLFKKLHKKSADINAQTVDGDTLLSYGVLHGVSVPILEAFLSHGADLTLKNHNDLDALKLAEEKQNSAHIELLHAWKRKSQIPASAENSSENALRRRNAPAF